MMKSAKPREDVPIACHYDPHNTRTRENSPRSSHYNHCWRPHHKWSIHNSPNSSVQEAKSRSASTRKNSWHKNRTRSSIAASMNAILVQVSIVMADPGRWNAKLVALQTPARHDEHTHQPQRALEKAPKTETHSQ